MFINVSNHPSNKWSKEQLDAAREFENKVMGPNELVDIKFPNIDPNWGSFLIREMANKMAAELVAKYSPDCIVHVMGESCFVYHFVSALDRMNVLYAVCSTTDRVSNETVNPDGSITKTTEFKFVRFRSYY